MANIHTYKIKTKLPSNFKGIVITKDNSSLKFLYHPGDTDYECEPMEDSFVGGIFEFTPAFSKEFLAELQYWKDPHDVDVNYSDLLPYQTAQDFPFQKDKKFVASGITTYFPEITLDNNYSTYIDIFTGRITKYENAETNFTVYRGNDPEFRQFYCTEIPNIYDDGIYIYNKKDKYFELYVLDENDDSGNNDYFLESDDNGLKDVARAYPYKAHLIALGKYITIKGIDTVLPQIPDDSIEVAIQTDKDFYFITKAENIKNSPTHGSSISFIYMHDTEGEDYGYYY